MVWAYLANRCLDTAGWSHIKRYQATTDDRRAWLALSLFYGGRAAKYTRKIVVACAALEQLAWSNKATFKFNDYATQLINHFNTLERSGQAKSDQEKVMKLLDSMNTSNVAINTRIELNRQGVSFQDAIVALSTSIASIYPLIGMKGRTWRRRCFSQISS